MGTTLSKLNTVSIVYLNFNTDRRLLNKLYSTWNHLSAESRIPEIAKKAIEFVKDGVIVVIFEITEDIQEQLVSLITGNCKCNHIGGTYNQSVGKTKSDGSFKFSVFLPTHIEVKNVVNAAFTNAGMIENCDKEHKEFELFPEEFRPKNDNDRKAAKWYMDITLGELFEKGFLCLHLNCYGTEFYLIVTHMGLSNQARIKQSEKLMKWISENIPKDSMIVLGGDFNAFDAVKNGTYMEQMQIFLKDGFKNLLDFGVGTFIPYPYDVRYLLDEIDSVTYDKLVSETRTRDATPEEIQAFKNLIETASQKSQIPATLDNVFVKGFKDRSKCAIHKNSSDHVALFVEIDL